MISKDRTAKAKSKVPAVQTIVTGSTGATKFSKQYTKAKEEAKLSSKKETSLNDQKKKAAAKNSSKTTQTATQAAATGTSADYATANGMDIVNWSGNGGISFFVKPNQVKGVKNITIKASAETEEKASDGEKITSKKNAGGIEITMTGILNSMLGVDVEGAAKAIIEAARTGASGYFYIAGKKLFTPNFMMAESQARDILLTGTGEWVNCEIDMTLKQCSKYGGESSGSNKSGGSGGKYYKVQISGMSELKVWATSVQGAVTKACGANYTGYVSVDGTTHYVNKGKIDDAYAAEKVKKSVQTTNDAKKQSQNVLKDSKRNAQPQKPANKSVSNGKAVRMLK